jgi:deazaflavin-dependent oxidoreductase (nitroreductase family)
VNAPVDYQVQPIDLSLPKEQLLAIADRMATKYGRMDAEGNETPPTNPNLDLGNSSTGNPSNASQWAGNQGNAGQWGQGQGGASQWNQNKGSTNQANPSQWSQQDQGSTNQWGQGQGGANQWNQGGISQGNFGDWNKRVIEEFRANGGNVGMLPTPVLLITTTGRKSGKLYTTPVGYMIDADQYIVVPSSATADWYLNVLANPQVTVEIGTESFTATATLVEGEQREVFLQRARKVAEAAATAWRPPQAGDMADHVTEDGPVVALQPVDR